MDLCLGPVLVGRMHLHTGSIPRCVCVCSDRLDIAPLSLFAALNLGLIAVFTIGISVIADVADGLCLGSGPAVYWMLLALGLPML